MDLFRKISVIDDIGKAAFVVHRNGSEQVIDRIADVLGINYDVYPSSLDGIDLGLNKAPDMFMIVCGSNCIDKGIDTCHVLREQGYFGIIVLVTDDISVFADTSTITSEGFDNFILMSDSKDRIRDTVHWAILNRRRRNKYTIQFDDNIDCFYTVDSKGRVYDINRRALDATSHSPKDVVNNGINVRDIGSLNCFDTVVSPLITLENVGQVFGQTVDEGEHIHQVVTRVHNVPTMGLVATVVRTDITKTIYTRTMDILMNSITMLSQRDNYTAGHSSRVFYYSRHIADRMGLLRSRKFFSALCFAALLHDIGKIGIKDNILLKPTRLEDMEYIELRSHSVKGYNMLRPYAFLHDCIDLIRSHHERPDGMGYPDKLRANRIPLGAAIISVADGFDAMTTSRPYRKSLDYNNAIREITANLGTQFHRKASGAFLSLITPDLASSVQKESRKPLGRISEELINSIIH